MNLRTFNFHDRNSQTNTLEYLPKRKVKEIIGNIIPAIASTNALVAAI